MEMKKRTVNGQEYTFLCNYRGTRNGFAHDAELYAGDCRIGVSTAHYINRTWECYRFQTAMLGAVDDAMRDIVTETTYRVKRENGWDKLTEKRREAIKNRLAENERYKNLSALRDNVAQYDDWEAARTA